MRRFILAVFAFLAISCNKNKEHEVVLSQWTMIKVEGATTGRINEKNALTVYWPYTSGSCDVLDQFKESKQGNTVFIKAYGHSTGVVCTADAGIKTKVYNFVSVTPGTFELRFINRDSSYISHQITVN